MKRITRIGFRIACCAAASVLLILLASSLEATPINYGDFPGTNVTFRQVTEDSATDPTPLYGPPTVSGDGISFSPTAAFSAFTSGGGIDLTDGKLNTTLDVNNQGTGAIHNISVNERGDYTLLGVGTTTTATSVSAPVLLTLIGVDGSPVSPFALYSGNVVFTPSGGTYNLITDPGSGVIWTGTLLIDVDALMAANSISGRATTIKYVMDNSLFAQSESSSLAFIEKKDGFVKLAANVPEPSTVVLALIGLVPLAWRIRRRRAG